MACPMRFSPHPCSHPPVPADTRDLQHAEMRSRRKRVTQTGSKATSHALHSLPEALLDFTLDETLDLFHVIGAAALRKPSIERPPLRRDKSVLAHLPNRREIPRIPVQDRVTIVREAIEILRDWPSAFWRVLENCEDRFSDPSASAPMLRDLGSVYKILVKVTREERNGRPLPLLSEALEEYRKRKSPGRPGATIRTTDPLASRLGRYVSVVSLSAENGLSYSLAKQIYRRTIAGLDQESYDAPDPVLVAEFTRRYKLLVGSQRQSVNQQDMCEILIGDRLRYRFADWHAPDLLPLDPSIQGFKKSVRYDLAVVNDLLSRLRQRVCRVAGVHGLIQIASHAFMARFATSGYGRAEVLRDLLAGRLPYYAAVLSPRYADFHLDPAEATAILQRRYMTVRTFEARFVSWTEAQTLFIAAFGPDIDFTRAKCGELRRTGVVTCLQHKDRRFLHREQLFAWADEHLAPPGRSVRLFLEESGLQVTEHVMYHSRPYNKGRVCMPV